MKLISFAIASIVDANTGYRQPTSGGQVDYVYAGKQGRTIRSHQLLALFGRLLGGLGGLVERSRAKAEQRRQLAELGATPVKKVLTVGGGAANKAWTAIRRRVLGVPVSVAAQTQAAYGSARLAQIGLMRAAAARK